MTQTETAEAPAPQRFFPILLILAPLVLLGGALVSRAAKSKSNEPPLPVISRIPEFSFTERSGKTVSLGDLKGHPWVADFIFTRCGGPCPMMCQRMAALQSSLVNAPDVRLVTFTLDPKHDTVEVLKEYAQGWQADPERWLFLTGERDAIHTLCREGFKLAAATGNGESIIHSDRLVLVDAQGQVRATHNGQDPEAAQNVLRDLERLRHEPRP